MARPQKYVLTALDPRDPSGGGTWEVGVDQSRVEWLTRGGIDARFFRMYLLPETLESPLWVFQGLRVDQEDTLCYVSRPERDFPKEGIDLPAPKNKVFVAFVTPFGNVYEWGWENSDPEEPTCPESFRHRFEKTLWPPPPR